MALNVAKEKVYKLETAIKKLDSIKRHLSHNAADIKGEIHSCVSHNLESLRGREVSLLNRVDEVVSLKEEALQQQQARLNQALGVLKTRMALTGNSALDSQMTDVLTKFNDIDLSPDETPHIAFRADHMSLRQCIMNYGRVDSNALPLLSAFDDPGKPSASLPRHLEEYEDADHHIFYKTVQELKDPNPATKSITVTIPKLSTKMEDWLQKRFASQEMQTSFSSRPSDMLINKQCNSSASTPSSSQAIGSCSLNNWLSQIKGHADQEEEHNFEIFDNSCGKKEMCCSRRPIINKDDLTQWLLHGAGHQESKMDTSGPNPNLFQHIPTDTKFWLHQAQQRKPTSDEMKVKDMFSHISKEPSSWLRSRAYIRNQDVKVNTVTKQKPVSFEDKSIHLWLKKPSFEGIVENTNNNNNGWLMKTTQTASVDKQDKKKVQPFVQLEDICKANELCSTLADCVCKPNCVLAREQDTQYVKNPLNPMTLFKQTAQNNLPLSQWLSTVDEKEMDVNENETDCDKNGTEAFIGFSYDHFVEDDDDSDDKWLIKPPEPTVENSDNSNFKDFKEEANLWVQQKEIIPACQDGETLEMKFNSCHMNRPLSEWLATSSKCPNKMEEMKEESEGWSICSSPTSFNSEQFNKDVYTAANYIDKWIM